MGKKIVPFWKKGIDKLPDDKPVVYGILTESEKPNYVGSAMRGRVRERLQEHLEKGRIPGAKVRIEQTSTIAEAQDTEERKIARSDPKYNRRGK